MMRPIPSLSDAPAPSLLRELHFEVLQRLGNDVSELHIERAVLGIFLLASNSTTAAADSAQRPLKACRRRSAAQAQHVQCRSLEKSAAV